MVSTPVLALPNFNEEFTIEIGASGAGIGAVLCQNGRPLAFVSKGLSATKLAWSTYEKEMLANLEAFQDWRPYLLGCKFRIVTNHKNLRCLLEHRITTSEQQKWITKLLGFDYEIAYKPGKENNAADALSSRGQEDKSDDETHLSDQILASITTPTWAIWAEFEKATRKEAELLKIKEAIVMGKHGGNEYMLRNGRMVEGTRDDS